MSSENESSMTTDIDVADISEFTPFDALKKKNLRNLLPQIEAHQAEQGQTLFKKGDLAKRSVYLLSGTIALVGHDGERRMIAAGTEEASCPIAPVLPRQVTAVAVDDVRYFSIDSELLDVTLTLDQTGIYEVGDFSAEISNGEGDWMTSLLQSKTFQQVPPHCIQMIFNRLERMDFKAGDVVIQQGSDGDYFYIVRSGRCMVTRETAANKGNIDLAELGVGGTFGEEALISQAGRNATVKMLTDGILMRLGREDFQALLNEPTLVMLDAEAAEAAVANSGTWLDVRVPSEFKSDGKDGAVNLPLYLLRHKLGVLNRETRYVVYCDTGRRSSAASFILNQNGFQTVVLKGGLNSSLVPELSIAN